MHRTAETACQYAQAGNGAVEIIRVGRAVAGDAAAGLGPAGRVRGVGMDHAAYFGESLVDLYMGGGVRGGLIVAFDDIAFQVNNDHIIGGQFVIIHAAGLDGEEAGFPVDLTDIAPGKCDQFMFGKQHIGFIDSFFQFF